MKDLTSLKTYIIDSQDPHEVDDAISLEIKGENMEKETKGMTKEEKFYYKTGIIYSGSETSSVILSAI